MFPTTPVWGLQDQSQQLNWELKVILIFSLRPGDYVIKWRPLALSAPLRPIIEKWVTR